MNPKVSKIFQSVGRWMLSNAFQKSTKLIIHLGLTFYGVFNDHVMTEYLFRARTLWCETGLFFSDFLYDWIVFNISSMILSLALIVSWYLASRCILLDLLSWERLYWFHFFPFLWRFFIIPYFIEERVNCSMFYSVFEDITFFSVLDVVVCSLFLLLCAV